MQHSFERFTLERSRQAGPARLAATMLAAVALMAPLAGQAEEVKGNAEAARDKVSMCVGCHQIPGYKATFPQVHMVPMIVGQSEKYIVNALNAYRKGDRSHPTMRGIAGSLSDQDIADLAAYYAGGAK